MQKEIYLPKRNKKMPVDTCLVIENFSNEILDSALELRYEMVEQVGEDRGEQIQFLKECMDGAFGNADYVVIAAAAALLTEIQAHQ
jgi:hypothetical protein